MDFEEFGGDDDEHNEFADTGGEEVAPEYNVKDAILFVIDARTSMCPSADGQPSPFAQSLQCVLACMKDRILGGEHDLVGVLLFGTQETKVPNGQGFPHIYLLQELEEPSAASMRNISLVLSSLEGSGSGDAKAEGSAAPAADFGHLDAAGGALDLGNVLWVTSILFNNAAAKNTRRRVYLMTNDDNPCVGQPAARARALTRSRDLQDASVWIEPFFFASPPPATFDLGPTSFWRELVGSVRANYKPPTRVATDDASATTAKPGGASDSAGGGQTASGGVGASIPEDTSSTWLQTCVAADGADLLARVRRTAHRKRVQWASELTISGSYALSFAMVGIVKPYSRPNPRKLEARSNEELKSETALICNTHGQTLQREDIFKAYQYGGKWVYFDQSELSTFGTEEGLAADGLTLLGFKDVAKLKLHHNLGAAKFLQPTERLPGSTTAMAALVQQMHAKGKMAIARMAKGKSGIPRLVALLPQLGPEVEDAAAANDAVSAAVDRTRLPCGLHLIPLPYAEDIRSISKPPALPPDAFSDPELSSARELVRALTLPIERNPVGTVTNPAVATHFNHLELLALNVPGAEAPPVHDGTRPDALWLEGAREPMAAFRSAFELTDVDLDGGAAKKPRLTAPKVEKPSQPSSLADWIALHLKGQIAQLTAPAIKEFCKGRGLPVGGRKDDLLARVHDFLEEEMARDPSLAGGGGGASAGGVKDEA